MNIRREKTGQEKKSVKITQGPLEKEAKTIMAVVAETLLPVAVDHKKKVTPRKIWKNFPLIWQIYPSDVVILLLKARSKREISFWILDPELVWTFLSLLNGWGLPVK
ncbi:MAG: hypothetical protein JW971_05830 [Synergistales bacterium]|nr:hypothetical protein [Synergistales bacterium]